MLCGDQTEGGQGYSSETHESATEIAQTREDGGLERAVPVEVGEVGIAEGAGGGEKEE